MKKAFLGIDYGKARIGLAISDTGLIARPLKTIENKGNRKNFFVFDEIINKNNIKTIILGLPLHLLTEEYKLTRGGMRTPDDKFTTVNGKEIPETCLTPMACEIIKFGSWLESQFNIPVIYQDERYTSCAAEREIRENMQIKNSKKIKELVDNIAASMILNEYLKENNSNGLQN